MQFQDELAGGVVLIRPALQSPEYQPGASGWCIRIDGSAEFNDVVIRSTLESANYVPGSAGWHLGQDGHAEFNDVVIRGATSVGGEAFYYNGAPGPGTLVLAVAAAAGTDPYGNAYPDGMTVFGSTGTINLNTDTTATWANNLGSRIKINAGGGQAAQEFQPPNVSGVQWDNASLGTNIDTTLGANTPSLFLQSPGSHSNYDSSSIRLFGSSPGTRGSQIDLWADLVRVVGRLTASNLRSGIATTPAPPSGGGVTTTTVTFPTPMASVPAVSIDPVSGADPAGTTIRGYVDSLTTTGFTIRAYRSSNSATNWAWIAYA